ncbi:low-density lipoprotein receptor-related protein 6-like [Limulus polyphemus]|uniref:Low-density lipoprotein receptor-related protein 6-like n=1 Tax=Limulus polyphemus TaxID=6850 RepID=A0ABM1B386_LIMPO|nr:low-density lipoprotein receptor-related protein 6-like [Limulus polyphemus]
MGWMWLLVFISCFYLTRASPLLLFANRQDIRLIDIHGSGRNESKIFSSGVEDATALDFYIAGNKIFWTDIGLEMIKGMHINDSKSLKKIITTGLISPDGLACDWLGKKLYWTDSESNRIEVSNLDGSFRKVLFWDNLDQPRAISLVPMDGLMFWTDWGETPKIERAGMHGEQSTRKVIVTKDIFWPNGLTVDYETKRIYWADGKLKFISSMDFNGEHRQMVVHGEVLSHPFALTLFRDKLYWTDWQTKSIHSCSKTSCSSVETVVSKLKSPMDIHVYVEERQRYVETRCDTDNGGCSHLCLMSPVHPFYACACPTGIRLLEDNKTCAYGVQEQLLLARRTDLRRISLDTPDYTDVVLQLKDIKHSIAIDYDPIEEYVYWTDDETRTIKRAFLNGTGQENLIDTEIQHPDGIAVDWIAKNIYWTDTGTDRIEVARFNGSSRKVLISENLDEPRAIVVDPPGGYMYWTDWGNKSKIERAALDGTLREILISTGLFWPNGLAIDYEERKLYWGDARTDKIEVSNLDGTDRRELVSDQLPHIFGFTLLGTNACAINMGNCSHLCLNRPGKSYVCACPMGWELKTDNKTCKVPEAFLLYSSQVGIRRISLDTYNVEIVPVSSAEEIYALDSDIGENRLYWTDTKHKRISRAFINGTNVEYIVTTGLEVPDGIAVDWVAHNLYWTDMGYDRIEVSRLDGTSRKVLIWKDLDNPHSIALHPGKGRMYWSVWGKDPKIELAAMDGSKRKMLIGKVGRAKGLTVDYQKEKLYWVDIDKYVIEYSDLEGNERKQFEVSGSPFLLTQYGNYIYWNDNNKKTIQRVSKSDGGNHSLVHSSMDDIYSMLAFHASRHSGWNPCSGNGGCSHLCLALSRSNKTCACPTHFLLDNESGKCNAPRKFLLYSQKSYISRIVIDSEESPDTILTINDQRNIKAVSYDPVEEFVYWIDGRSQTVKRGFENGTMISTIVAYSKNSLCPDDIVIDPYSRLLYLSCTEKNMSSINVTRLDGTPVGVLITGENQKPRALALHFTRGLLYWINIVSSPRIERAKMDGLESVTVIKEGLQNPEAIAVDSDKDILFWSDYGTNRIESSDIDGGHRKTLRHDNKMKPLSLAVYKEFLYWIDSKHGTLQRFNKLTGEDFKQVLARKNHLTDLISVFPYKHFEKRSCINGNGGCTHLCLFGNNGEKRCACPKDLILAKDGKSCINPPCPSNKFSCSNGKNCIPIEWRCDGSSECDDGSDESNCPECNAHQFTCKDGHCITWDHVCDGIPQCSNGIDEKCCKDSFLCHESVSGVYNCIQSFHLCDGVPDCPDGSDEEESQCKNSHHPQVQVDYYLMEMNKTNYTIGIVIAVVVVLLIGVLAYICKKKTQGFDESEEGVDVAVTYKVLNQQQTSLLNRKNLPTGVIVPAQGNSTCPGRSVCRSELDSTNSPLYDRNHVTGASSSSSSTTPYPQETRNPPPSPVTIHSQCTYDCCCSSSVSLSRKSHPYYHERSCFSPSTSFITDACGNESEPYPYRQRHYNSRVELSYDSDTCHLPKTKNHYIMTYSSDSCPPPTPPTERSYCSFYIPPPPSPVPESDC